MAKFISRPQYFHNLKYYSRILGILPQRSDFAKFGSWLHLCIIFFQSLYLNIYIQSVLFPLKVDNGVCISRSYTAFWNCFWNVYYKIQRSTPS